MRRASVGNTGRVARVARTSDEDVPLSRYRSERRQPEPIFCAFCARDISRHTRVACAECHSPRVEHCIDCFSVGAALLPHRPSHDYIITQEATVPVFQHGWTADEERRLLDALTIYGPASWSAISSHVGTKSALKCESHYQAVYLDCPSAPMPDPANILPAEAARQRGITSSHVEKPSTSTPKRDKKRIPSSSRRRAVTVPRKRVRRMTPEVEDDDNIDLRLCNAYQQSGLNPTDTYLPPQAHNDSDHILPAGKSMPPRDHQSNGAGTASPPLEDAGAAAPKRRKSSKLQQISALRLPPTADEKSICQMAIPRVKSVDKEDDTTDECGAGKRYTDDENSTEEDDRLRKTGEPVRCEILESMSGTLPRGMLRDTDETDQDVTGDAFDGYMPKRGEFDVEWDDNAEDLIADLVVSDQDSPHEVELKLRLIEIYNERLDERQRVKSHLLSRNLLDFSRLREEHIALPVDQRSTSLWLKRFSRLIPREQFEEFERTVMAERAASIESGEFAKRRVVEGGDQFRDCHAGTEEPYRSNDPCVRKEDFQTHVDALNEDEIACNSYHLAMHLITKPEDQFAEQRNQDRIKETARELSDCHAASSVAETVVNTFPNVTEERARYIAYQLPLVTTDVEESDGSRHWRDLQMREITSTTPVSRSHTHSYITAQHTLNDAEQAKSDINNGSDTIDSTTRQRKAESSEELETSVAELATNTPSKAFKTALVDNDRPQGSVLGPDMTKNKLTAVSDATEFLYRDKIVQHHQDKTALMMISGPCLSSATDQILEPNDKGYLHNSDSHSEVVRGAERAVFSSIAAPVSGTNRELGNNNSACGAPVSTHGSDRQKMSSLAAMAENVGLVDDALGSNEVEKIEIDVLDKQTSRGETCEDIEMDVNVENGGCVLGRMEAKHVNATASCCGTREARTRISAFKLSSPTTEASVEEDRASSETITECSDEETIKGTSRSDAIHNHGHIRCAITWRELAEKEHDVDADAAADNEHDDTESCGVKTGSDKRRRAQNWTGSSELNEMAIESKKRKLSHAGEAHTVMELSSRDPSLPSCRKPSRKTREGDMNPSISSRSLRSSAKRYSFHSKAGS